MFIFDRIKYNFFALCCVFASGFSLLFVSRPALGQDLTPQYYSSEESGTVPLYPIYFIVNADITNSISGTHYGTKNVFFFDFLSPDQATLGDLRRKELMKAILDYEGLNYCYLSDIIGTLTIKNSNTSPVIQPDGIIIASAGRPCSITFHPNPAEGFSKYLCLFNLWGYVFYRASKEVNCFDVFYCLNSAPAANSLPSKRLWCLRVDDGIGVGDIFSTETTLVGNNIKTYQFIGSFSVELTSSKHEFVDTSDYSFPLELDDFGSNVKFALNDNKNRYWASWANPQADASSAIKRYSSDLHISAPGYKQEFYWPYYSTPYTVTLGNDTLPYNHNYTSIVHAFDLDTDRGGMRDVVEWYQTKHNIFDPADDSDETPEIDDDPELPPPKEAEDVTDIGKDTQERYKYYWDEEVGNDEELDNLEPPPVDEMNGFDPPDINLDYAYKRANDAVNSGLGKNQGFKSNYDSTFADLNGDNLLWTFSPAINSPVAYMPLPDVTIDPQAVFDTDYGIYFSIFRACLLLVEFLCFCYGLYKLAISALTGSDDKGDNAE